MSNNIIYKSLILLMLSFFFFGTISQAKYIQVEDQEATIYPYEPLNFQVFFPKDNMTVGEIISIIETNSNLRVFDHIEIPNDKIIQDSSTFKTIGGMLHRILKEYNAIPYVDQYVIHLDFYDTTTLKLPYGWDIQNTVEKIQKYFKEVQFNIEGFNIKAFGDKLQIKEVNEKFTHLNKIANQKLKLKIKIFDYSNEKFEHKKIYLAKRSHQIEIQDIVKEIDVQIGHNEDLNVILGDGIYTLTFDLQKQEILLKNINTIENYKNENKIKIPLSYFPQAGLVVPNTKNKYNFSKMQKNNSLFFTFSVSEGFFNN